MTEEEKIKKTLSPIIDDILLKSKYGFVAYQDRLMRRYEESTQDQQEDIHQDHPKQLYFVFEEDIVNEP